MLIKYKRDVMCERVRISKNIASISTRSLERNLEAVSGVSISANKLARLNNSMDHLYEIIYSQFNDIDKTDYQIIGPQLQLLLKTVKDLFDTFIKIGTIGAIKKEVDTLWSNYSALYEINDDIVRFRINPNSDKNLSIAMQNASSLIDSI